MRLHHVRRGSGEPLLLVHGIGDTNLMWSHVLGRLARAHEIFAVDAPGFGGSAPLDGPPTVGRLAVACADFMREQGHDRFHVAGNSMGGAIALELAHMGSARSATALSPAGFDEGLERTYTTVSLHLTRAMCSALSPIAGTLTRRPLMRRVLAGQMVRHGERYSPEDLAVTIRGTAAAPSFGAMVRGLAEHRIGAALTFTCPVTVAWGSHDLLLLSRPQSARARERLPQARHVTLHGCGHIPTWDDPEQVARVILETTAEARD
jgi:pimeloyl-ACP methyl ester carboxylesterase